MNTRTASNVCREQIVLHLLAVLVVGVLTVALPLTAGASEKDWLGLSSAPYDMMPSRNLRIDPVGYYRARIQARQLYSESEYKSAASLFRKLTQQFPDDGDNWLLLGDCEFELGNWIEAASSFETALRYGAFPFDLTDDVNPNDTMVKIARAHAQAGNVEESVSWIEKALKFRHDDRVTLAGDDSLDPIRSDHRFSALAGSLDQAPISREAGWRADLAFLRAEMIRLHPTEAHTNSRETIDSAFANLDARIVELDDFQMTAEIARLLSLMVNGHNLLLPFPSEHGGLLQFPLRFYAFSDGLFVVDAEEEFSDLVGARIDKFGSTGVKDALAALEPFVARDNNTQLDFLGVLWLTTPHILEAAGIIDDATNASLHLTMPDGRRRTVNNLPLTPFKLNTHGLESSDTKVKEAVYLSNFGETFWMRELPKRKAFYVQLTDVQPCCGTTISELTKKAQRSADQMDAEYLIIDLRNNAGGNSYLGMGLVKFAAYFESSRGDGSVFVLFGRNTLSAAHTILIDIDRVTNAIFVGEPSGSSANAYAENGWFRLPYSGVLGFISSQLHQYSWPEDHRVWIAPHVPVFLTSEQYFDGRDPALEAIFKIVGGK